MPAQQPENEPSDRLRPGDVLLFHGHGALSWAIRRFEESDVDDAAIVLDPETMATATVSGLQRLAIEPAIDESAFTYVCRLARDVDARPVALAARSLTEIHDLSVHERVIMLAVLGMTRRLPIEEPTCRRLLHRLLDLAADMVDALACAGRQLMVASELAYRSFEGTGDPAFSVEILLASEKVRASATAVRRNEPRDAALMEWSLERFPPGPADPASLTAATSSDLRSLERRAKDELTPLIRDFSRVDSPHDPFVAGHRGDCPIGVSAEVTDDDLQASVVGFRDRIVRLAVAPDLPAGGALDHPWGMFRAVTSFVTPGDLRYSPSLRLVTSLRPRRPDVPRCAPRDLSTG